MSIPLPLESIVRVPDPTALYFIISLPIFTYPGYDPLTVTPSKVEKLELSATLIVVVSEEDNVWVNVVAGSLDSILFKVNLLVVEYIP